MNLREAMEKRGASSMQINSKTTELIEQILAEDAGIVPGTVVEYAKRLEKGVRDAQNTVSNCKFEMERMKNNAELIARDVETAKQDVSKAVEKYKQNVIEDRSMKDALVMYTHMLQITKDVFGDENLTENVMMQAIEAGSYAIWRGIMGGKFDDDSKGRRRL